METVVWLGAYLVGFALLQLYLYRYFMSSTTESPDGTATGISDGVASVERDHTPPEGVDRQDLARCSACGAYNQNDQMFTYCRECGEQLR